MLTRATSQRPMTKGVCGSGFSLARSIASNSERRLPSRGGANGPVVPFLDLLGNRGVGLGEREELAMAQRRQHPHLDHFYRILRGRLVAWAPHPRRDNGDTVVPRQLVVAAVQHRIPVEGVGDAGLEIVRDQLGGTGTDIGEGADMGT